MEKRLCGNWIRNPPATGNECSRKIRIFRSSEAAIFLKFAAVDSFRWSKELWSCLKIYIMSDLSFSIENILYGASKKKYLEHHFCPFLPTCPWASASLSCVQPHRVSSWSRKAISVKRKRRVFSRFQVDQLEKAFREKVGGMFCSVRFFLRNIFLWKTRIWWPLNCVCRGNRCFSNDLTENIINDIKQWWSPIKGDNMVSKPKNKTEEVGSWSRTKWTDPTTGKSLAGDLKKIWSMRRCWHLFERCSEAWLNTLLSFTDCPTVAASLGWGVISLSFACLRNHSRGQPGKRRNGGKLTQNDSWWCR